MIYFGIVESTEECKQDIEFGCWTGENCSPTNPYLSSDESIELDYTAIQQMGTELLALNYSMSFTSVFQGDDVVSSGVQQLTAPQLQMTPVKKMGRVMSLKSPIIWKIELVENAGLGHRSQLF